MLGVNCNQMVTSSRLRFNVVIAKKINTFCSARKTDHNPLLIDNVDSGEYLFFAVSPHYSSVVKGLTLTYRDTYTVSHYLHTELYTILTLFASMIMVIPFVYQFSLFVIRFFIFGFVTLMTSSIWGLRLFETTICPEHYESPAKTFSLR